MFFQLNYKLRLLIKLLLISCFVSCFLKKDKEQEFLNTNLTTMTFLHKEYDFGKIPMKKSVSTIFKFSNTGKEPLVIKEVTTSCGCTVPEWPKETIKPNENEQIKIVYDAKYPGRFNKTITVFYNGEDSPLELTIKGEVSYPETEKASTNKTN